MILINGSYKLLLLCETVGFNQIKISFALTKPGKIFKEGLILGDANYRLN